MEMVTVTSSLAAKIGYDVDTAAFYVQHHPKADGTPGSVWRYFPVVAAYYERAIGGFESIGKIINAIKHDPAITAERVVEMEIA